MSARLPSSAAPVQVQVTPQSAGWQYLSFRVHGLQPGDVLEGKSGDEESVLVVLGGRLRWRMAELETEAGARQHVFAGLPYHAYLPRRTAYRIEAVTAAELAWGSAPCEKDHPPRLLGPGDCKVEMRGARNVARQITHLIDPGFLCQRLLCVEVYTPSGNWSSYPPHRHDEDDLPRQVKLEEVYYYRVKPPGFAIQRLYGGSTDELVMAKDKDLVLVRDGYHPVVAGPGYDVYYLNVLAGDTPSWAAADDPDLAWVRGVWDSPEPLSLPMAP